jgi:dual specificity protein kinase YAK1
MTQLLQGLDFIHSLGVIHADIKTDNILFQDEDSTSVCLIDFGSAGINDAVVGAYIQSRFYRSPEILLGLPYDTAIDIWSAGCVAAELFLDFALFGCESEFDAIHAMVGLLGPFPEELVMQSTRWQRYFAATRSGLQPKGDPVEVLLTKHCYHQIFEQSGPAPIERLIADHCQVTSDEEIAWVVAFSAFVRSLLTYEPFRRLTARQALLHPFITGDIADTEWEPPPDPRKSPPPVPSNTAAPPSGNRLSFDFLSLM